jgi:hypothetical protein
MEFHLAELNIARVLYPLDHPAMADFVNGLDRINQLAESSEGFCWRLKEDNNNATDIRIYNDDSIIVNLSVWRSVEDLFQFAYRTEHTDFFRRKKEWFDRLSDMHMVLWWVPAGHQPGVAEAEERLTWLRRNGDSPYAFSFKKRFSPEEAMGFDIGVEPRLTKQ